MNSTNNPSFPQVSGFSKELRTRVQAYFTHNQIEDKETNAIRWKAIIWLSLHLGAFVVILTGWVNIWAVIGLAVLMGVAKAAIGMNTMHSANHGAFSQKRRVNKLAGSSLILFGGNPFFWRLQHNVLHHTYTNIHQRDEDIHAGALLRFSHSDRRRWHHKYQHLYFPFLYCLMTFSWVFYKDFDQLVRYEKMGLIRKHRSTFNQQLVRTLLIKVNYLLLMIGLPLLIGAFTWWQWMIGFLTIHFTASLILSLVFQSAHVIEETNFPVPDNNGKMNDEWMIHQLNTTSNFATKNKWWTWFLGGLNFQVEHHLFPNIGSAHLKEISKIVKKCAAEFEIPYHEAPTFSKALFSHIKHLKQLGSA